jgi:vacuolar protein sorting-associated protein 45
MCRVFMNTIFLNVQLGFISVVFSQSDILHKDVYLVEPVDAPPTDEPMGHLKAICFLRPTGENITHLKRHLKSPRYGEYHLCECALLVQVLPF